MTFPKAIFCFLNFRHVPPYAKMTPRWYRTSFAIEHLFEITTEDPLTDLDFRIVLRNVNKVGVINIFPFKPFRNARNNLRNFPTKCFPFTEHRIGV